MRFKVNKKIKWFGGEINSYDELSGESMEFIFPVMVKQFLFSVMIKDIRYIK